MSFWVGFAGIVTAGMKFTILGYAYIHGSHMHAADRVTVKYGYREDDTTVGVMTFISYLYSDKYPKGDGFRTSMSKSII